MIFGPTNRIGVRIGPTIRIGVIIGPTIRISVMVGPTIRPSPHSRKYVKASGSRITGRSGVTPGKPCQ